MKTSAMDDFASWWDQLNLEEWAKSVLDDVEQAASGSKISSASDAHPAPAPTSGRSVPPPPTPPRIP